MQIFSLKTGFISGLMLASTGYVSGHPFYHGLGVESIARKKWRQSTYTTFINLNSIPLKLSICIKQAYNPVPLLEMVIMLQAYQGPRNIFYDIETPSIVRNRKLRKANGFHLPGF